VLALRVAAVEKSKGRQMAAWASAVAAVVPSTEAGHGGEARPGHGGAAAAVVAAAVVPVTAATRAAISRCRADLAAAGKGPGPVVDSASACPPAVAAADTSGGCSGGRVAGGAQLVAAALAASPALQQARSLTVDDQIEGLEAIQDNARRAKGLPYGVRATASTWGSGGPVR
jgi:hypothetical protein